MWFLSTLEIPLKEVLHPGTDVDFMQKPFMPMELVFTVHNPAMVLVDARTVLSLSGRVISPRMRP